MPEPDAGPVGNALVAAFVWLFRHPEVVYPLALGICVLGVLLGAALLIAQAGARWIVVFYVWRRFFRWLRSRSRSDHPGGAGGHSELYESVMRSAGWRRRRSQAIHRAGRRCQECGAGGPLDVHHLSYAHLGDERPWELAALCESCHQRAHGR